MATPPSLQPMQADRVRLFIGVIVGLYWFIATIALRDRLLADPDIWWHIRTGTWVWLNGRVPTTDTFSFSFAGHPWIAKEWLSQLLYSRAFALGGWNGVLLLGAMALALGAIILYWATSAWLNPGLAAALALLGVFLAMPAVSIRPHLLTLPIVILWTNALFSAAARGRAPNPLWLIVIVLWANLHAAFTMGFVIAGFAFLDFLERTRPANRRETAAWLVFLILCPLVTLIHPYGYQAILATWLVVGPNEAVGQINEWQPFDAQEHWVLALGLMGMLLATLVSGFRLGVARALLLALLMFLFMTHLRYAFYLFPVVALLVPQDMARQFPKLSAAHWRQQPPDRSERLIAARFAPLMVVLGAVFIVAAGLELRVLGTAPPERVSASAAIAFAKAHGITGHVFNHHNFGGPLIFNDIPTFIDGRTDQLFLDSFIKDYATGPKDAKSMADTLQRYDIRWTLLPPGDPRAALLDKMPGWKRVYADPFATIHQRQ